MKLSSYIFLLPLLLLLNACNKTLDVDTPVFTIKTATITDDIDSVGNPVKKVTFELNGDADVLSFYSGELFHDYNYKDGRIVKTKSLDMTFSSNCKLNSGTIALANQLSIVASTDFSGKYVSADIHAAQWKDITSRFTISPLVTTDDFLPSGTVDVSNLAPKGDTFYIAFKYLCPPQTTAIRHTQWRIRDYFLKSITDIGSTTIASQSTAVWNMFHEGPLESGRSSTSSSQIVLRGNNSSANFSQSTEDWAISPPIQVGDDLDLGPDRPLAIKGAIDQPLRKFSYTYTQPGTYRVVFVASNVTVKDEQKVMREVTITIP